jgi:heme-degrading monooxygenase HmoA
MVVEYIRYNIPPDQQLAFEQAYAAASGSLDRSPNCLAYELARCVEDTSQYILRIEWDSAEGHMQGFRRSKGFGTFVANVRPYIPAILEMRHYAVTSVTSAQPGGAPAA